MPSYSGTTLPPFDHVLAGCLLVVWMYDDPPAANTPASRQRMGALLLLDELDGMASGLAALAALAEGLLRTDGGAAAALGTLHVALQGSEQVSAAAAATAPSRSNSVASVSSGGGGGHRRSPSLTAQCLLSGLTPAGSGSAAGMDALLPPAEQGVDGSRAIAAAVSAAVVAATPALRELGCAAVSVLAPGSAGASPLRFGWRWVPEAATQPPTANGCYMYDSFMSAVEPITGALLELSSLPVPRAPATSTAPTAQPPTVAPAQGLLYRPSRNRQWHLFTVVERRDARSPPLKRMFVRGLVRGLGHPALLAASYSGNGAAVATAAMQEMEEVLVSGLGRVWVNTCSYADAACAGV